MPFDTEGPYEDPYRLAPLRGPANQHLEERHEEGPWLTVANVQIYTVLLPVSPQDIS